MAAELELPVDDADAPPIVHELDEAIVQGRVLGDEFASYVPENVMQAEYAGRRLAVLERRRAEIEQQYAVWKARMDGWRHDELARVTPAAELFTRWLEAFGLRQRAIEPKRATIALPSVEISTRQKKDPSVEVDDEDVLLAWASEALTSEQYERVVATKESVRVSELRKIVEVVADLDNEGDVERYKVVDSATGAIVPGVHVDAPSTTAKVKLTQ